MAAVLAASGPVVTRSFRLGPADMYGMICWGREDQAFFLPRPITWELVSWADLLLPAVLAGLLLRPSRWTAALGTVALCGVLALRILVTVRAPGAGPLTGGLTPAGPFTDGLPPAGPLWTAALCSATATALLWTAARRPPRSLPWPELALWAAAVVAAAWTAVRISLIPGDESVSSFGWSASGDPVTLWNYPVLWSCKADADGLPVVLVALAATASAVLTDGTRRRIALAAAALLGVAAVEGFVPVALLADGERLREAAQVEAAMLIRWNLAVAAVLVAAATLWRRNPAPGGVGTA
ncbi:hypothetical protein GCM10009530_67380 [Microbispora corallina]|uniref:Uncharacterized protein n=1 Tax=Microbispora corallina TaxID=83302 RepID=A0ABQ4G9I8_9ACTN|nr:hypothetical protein Mco01_67390 [Microbispora corallina]